MRWSGISRRRQAYRNYHYQIPKKQSGHAPHPPFQLYALAHIPFWRSMRTWENIKNHEIFTIKLSASSASRFPNQGSIPWTPLGANPPDTYYGFALLRSSPCALDPLFQLLHPPWKFSLRDCLSLPVNQYSAKTVCSQPLSIWAAK